MQVVVAHQRLDGRRHRGAHLALVRPRVRIEPGGDRLLDLERELIEAPLRRQLNERADPQLEVARAEEHLRLAAVQVAHVDERRDALLRILHVLARARRTPPHLRAPQRGREVAQRADALLEVRLEQVERGAEPRVAGLLLRGERADEIVRVAARRQRAERGAHELGGEPAVARDVARVEERGGGGEVVLREAGRRAGLADRVADRELLVPQGIEQRIRDPLRGGLVAVVQDHEVDIGVRRELAARPASGRDQRHLRAIGRGDEPLRDLLIVDVADRLARRGALPRHVQPLGERGEDSLERGANAADRSHRREGHAASVASQLRPRRARGSSCRPSTRGTRARRARRRTRAPRAGAAAPCRAP